MISYKEERVSYAIAGFLANSSVLFMLIYDLLSRNIQIFIIVCSVVLSVGVFFFVVHVVRNYRKKLHEPDEKKIN